MNVSHVLQSQEYLARPRDTAVQEIPEEVLVDMHPADRWQYAVVGRARERGAVVVENVARTLGFVERP